MVLVTSPRASSWSSNPLAVRDRTVVPEVWKQIWVYFQEPGNLARAYKGDFERYDSMSDPSNMQAHIFMGVKP